MRIDGRKNDELRNIKFTHNFTKHALGSVLVECGDTKVIVTASVENKKPNLFSQLPKSYLRSYDALSFH